MMASTRHFGISELLDFAQTTTGTLHIGPHYDLIPRSADGTSRKTHHQPNFIVSMSQETNSVASFNCVVENRKKTDAIPPKMWLSGTICLVERQTTLCDLSVFIIGSIIRNQKDTVVCSLSSIIRSII